MTYRLGTGDIQPGFDTYIATADCSLVGKAGILTYLEEGRQLTTQVFDCSGKWDGGVVDGVSVLTAGGYAAELDHASWLAYGLGKVRIELDRRFVFAPKSRDKRNGKVG